MCTVCENKDLCHRKKQEVDYKRRLITSMQVCIHHKTFLRSKLFKDLKSNIIFLEVSMWLY